jgi:hypothetical protein
MSVVQPWLAAFSGLRNVPPNGDCRAWAYFLRLRLAGRPDAGKSSEALDKPLSTKMQVLVDVDDHIDASEELRIRVEGVVEGSLGRFEGQIARVEVHLAQLSHAPAGHARCCRMEAYAGALTPITVSHEGMTLTEAIHAAAAKLHRAVGAALRQRNATEGATAGDAQEDGRAPEEGLGQLPSS